MLLINKNSIAKIKAAIEFELNFMLQVSIEQD